MNKLIFIALFIVVPCVSFSQLSENFSDGLFQGSNRSVEWTGDVNKFIVNESLQLQLNASDAESPAQLKTSSNLSSNTCWEWWMKMGFNPTAFNYTKVFLCSDENDLADALNGLFVRIGYTGKNVCLIQSQKGKPDKTLIEGTTKRLDKTSVSIRLKAVWDKNGNFSLYSQLDDEADYVLEGNCNISESFENKVFGIACYFSSTRSQLFYFDDFLVREWDNDSPDPDPDPNDPALLEGDVIFSEIMANPGEGNPEYVELYNASNQSFNLKNCLYYYGDKSYKLPEGTINPGDYFVLTKTTATGSFPTGVKVFGVSSFPTMANTGKLLMFSTDQEDLIAWFEYSDKMYGSNDKKSGGWSLECIDFQNVSNTSMNWIASDEAGGTPGRDNSVKKTNPDTEIPAITSIQTLMENAEIKLIFSKPMDRQTLSAKSSFKISDSRYAIESLQTNVPQGTELTIQFSALPPQGELIELELEGVKDLSGFGLGDKKVIIGSGKDPDPDPNDPALLAGDVIFSEIMANPGEDNPEYVELYNASDKSFNLKNYLYYYGDKSYKLPEGTINPGDYFVLTKTTATGSFPTGVKVFGVTSFPAMANTGKLLMFSTDQEDLIAWFEYSDKMYGSNDKKSGGWSLECIDFQNVSNTSANWIASNEAGGTPGRDNSVKKTNPDTEIPTITSIQTLMESAEIKLIFSKPMDRQTLSAKSSFKISDNRYAIESLQTNVPQGTELTIHFPALPPQGELFELELEGVKDLSGFGLDDKKVIIGSGKEADPNEIIINEILFNPPTGGVEYVEIYNNSNKTVDLQFLSFTSRKSSDGSLNKLYPLAEKATLFDPGKYLVITKSRDLVCQFFNCHPESSFVELSVMPSLANTSGCAVLLNNQTNAVIDEFAYRENMHTAGISSKKGIALERSDFNRPANDESNWYSASSDSGFGTPGYQNSQQTNSTGMEDINVIYPVFGADNYYVHYRLDKPGYRCRAFVYDALGRRVNTLANNELLGVEGQLSWNGKESTNQSLAAGIYIIYMEVYNMDGDVKKFRKPVVVK